MSALGGLAARVQHRRTGLVHDDAIDLPIRIVEVDGKPHIHCLHRAAAVQVDTTPIGKLLSADRRRFLGRARREPA